MNILALNASYRGERGQTQHLINRVFDGGREAGAACETLTLAKLKINHCLGCNQCQRNARRLEPAPGGQGPAYEVRCVYHDKDDVSLVFEKMKQADLLIYATPIYVFQMSTLLKAVFERFYGACYSAEFRVTKSGLMFHNVDPVLMSKPFVSLVVCDNLENDTPANVRSYFKTFARFMEAEQVGDLVRNAGALSGHGHDPEAERGLPKLAEVYAAYRQAGRELAIHGRIASATQRRANQEIVNVPLFGLIKQIRLRSVKEKFVEKANEMRSKAMLE
jgi:multimeric flavodoxin WrbA